MIVAPLLWVLAAYWSASRVPFPPPEDESRGHVWDTSVLPVLVWQAQGMCPRCICVGHEKSTVMPTPQRRKLRPTKE